MSLHVASGGVEGGRTPLTPPSRSATVINHGLLCTIVSMHVFGSY